ncbi:VanZ family protein [Peribacillus cavernae]|uniref:VanZ family protein n=1 Tax=Peribacillus cavernae TaxID=1674310 RepID=UPI0035211FC9
MEVNGINVKTITLLTFTVSLSAECIQFYFQIGGFNVDDILLNTLGGLGYWVFMLCNYGKKRCFHRNL